MEECTKREASVFFLFFHWEKDMEIVRMYTREKLKSRSEIVLEAISFNYFFPVMQKLNSKSPLKVTSQR